MTSTSHYFIRNFNYFISLNDSKTFAIVYIDNDAQIIAFVIVWFIVFKTLFCFLSPYIYIFSNVQPYSNNFDKNCRTPIQIKRNHKRVIQGTKISFHKYRTVSDEIY